MKKNHIRNNRSETRVAKEGARREASNLLDHCCTPSQLFQYVLEYEYKLRILS